MTEPVRVWRVRRNNTSIDALIRDTDTPPGAEIRYLYDGAPVFTRQCPTRELALTDANQRLCELQRVGWATHW